MIVIIKERLSEPQNCQCNLLDEIIVDNFAGGGGASIGMELATGRTVALAINHDPDAILMHKTNHPYTKHLQASVWDVDPEEVCEGRQVGLAWFSPNCKHFSKAKGAALVDRNIRGLAWIVLRWAATVHPRVILLENVEEFKTWGPVRKGRPVKNKTGQTFEQWLSQFKALGYAVEYRELVAADYGAPTTRKRFVLIARCDGKPIVWPEPTHGPRDSDAVRSGRLAPWRSAAEIIDWSLPCPSIFEDKQTIKERYNLTTVRPLARNTLRRIIQGIDKFTIKSGHPFLVSVNHTGEFRGQDLENPLQTITAKNGYGIVAAHLVEYYGNAQSELNMTEPVHTVTSHDREELVLAHLAEFKGQDKGQSVKVPLRTITAGGGEFGVVNVTVAKATTDVALQYWPQIRSLLNEYCGYNLAEDEILLLRIREALYFIADIGLRMLTPRELYNAMGFPPDYVIDRDYTGKPYGKSKQVARCGNAVCPPMAEAVVQANLPEWCHTKISTMAELEGVVAS